MHHHTSISRSLAASCLVLTLAACARGAAPAAPQPVAAPAAAAPAAALPADEIPPHDSFTVQSRALGMARPVNVWVPPAYRASPALRLPVLYMPDGALDEDFPHVVHTVDSLIARGAIRPVLVVGIPNVPTTAARRLDLTGPTRFKADSAIAPRVGGSAAFRRFIADELRPAVDARYRTTGERALVGESLAGLFVVETFLAEPALFAHYVAFDPSTWWDGGSLAASAPTRLAATAGGAAPRTLVVALSSDGLAVPGGNPLAALLAGAPPQGVRWRYLPRPDLGHATIFRGAEATALSDALR